MMRIGARAHDFGTLPADQLAEKLASNNLCCAQLALNAAIEGLALKPGKLNPGLAWEVGQAFQLYGDRIKTFRWKRGSTGRFPPDSESLIMSASAA